MMIISKCGPKIAKCIAQLTKNAAKNGTKTLPVLPQALSTGAGRAANAVAKKNKVLIFAKWFSEELKHAKNTGTPVRSLEEIHQANVKLNGWLEKLFEKLGLKKAVPEEKTLCQYLSKLLENIDLDHPNISLNRILNNGTKPQGSIFATPPGESLVNTARERLVDKF